MLHQLDNPAHMFPTKQPISQPSDSPSTHHHLLSLRVNLSPPHPLSLLQFQQAICPKIVQDRYIPTLIDRVRHAADAHLNSILYTERKSLPTQSDEWITSVIALFLNMTKQDHETS